MARVKTDTADYFPHDADASAGDTLTALQGQFGNNGYAFWFKLLEILAATEGHYYSYDSPKIAMGIDWAGHNGLSQAISPAYTEYIGGYLMGVIQEMLNDKAKG